jgi:hypothetical protein
MMPAFVCVSYPFAETKMVHSRGEENCFVPEMLLLLNEMFLFRNRIMYKELVDRGFNCEGFKQHKYHDIFLFFSQTLSFCELISFC